MLTFNNVTVGYDQHPVVHNLHMTIEAGEFLALVGPNGAGKSTLLKTITGQIKPLQGKLVYQGFTHKEIAYLPQQTNIDTAFPMTVKQLACTGLWRELGGVKAITRKHKKHVDEVLSIVGLNNVSNHPINTLSGGQFRRMLFARILLQNARVILLDEPFVGIDTKTITDFVALLRQCHSCQRIFIVALHDIQLILNYFPSTLILSKEFIAYGKTSQVLTNSNHPYAHYGNSNFDQHLNRYTNLFSVK